MTGPEMRAKLKELGYSLSDFARWMIEHGDDRSIDSILRTNQRMVSGKARVAGEMVALLGLIAYDAEIKKARRKDLDSVVQNSLGEIGTHLILKGGKETDMGVDTAEWRVQLLITKQDPVRWAEKQA